MGGNENVHTTKEKAQFPIKKWHEKFVREQTQIVCVYNMYMPTTTTTIHPCRMNTK